MNEFERFKTALAELIESADDKDVHSVVLDVIDEVGRTVGRDCLWQQAFYSAVSYGTHGRVIGNAAPLQLRSFADEIEDQVIAAQGRGAPGYRWR